jgi:5-formyltetrahydrofolate cyclo-ligase
MYLKNIREQKKDLREQSMQFRRNLSAEEKAALDKKILRRVLALREYAGADVLYTYVSKPLETDTLSLITAALDAGKRVAVPRCLPETVGMEFYEIVSVDDLAPGTYGVLEPVPERCRPVRTSRRAVCVVPGLSFDSQGYRLGYGKGYYDRFLADFRGFTVGLCYSGCVRWNLPHGFYDRSVDILATEKYIRRMAGGPARR